MVNVFGFSDFLKTNLFTLFDLIIEFFKWTSAFGKNGRALRGVSHFVFSFEKMGFNSGCSEIKSFPIIQRSGD